jgi:hypothetical protein
LDGARQVIVVSLATIGLVQVVPPTVTVAPVMKLVPVMVIAVVVLVRIVAGLIDATVGVGNW